MVTIKLKSIYQKMDLIRMIDYVKKKKQEDFLNDKITQKLYEYAKKLRVSKELERIIALYVED